MDPGFGGDALRSIHLAYVVTAGLDLTVVVSEREERLEEILA
jgi:hypothetical protein